MLPFGSLLESLFDTVCRHVGFVSSKTGVQKTHQTIMKKSDAVAARDWSVSPLKSGSQKLPSGGWEAQGAQMLSLAKISKKLTSKVQRTSYSKVPKGTVADI